MDDVQSIQLCKFTFLVFLKYACNYIRTSFRFIYLCSQKKRRSLIALKESERKNWLVQCVCAEEKIQSSPMSFFLNGNSLEIVFDSNVFLGINIGQYVIKTDNMPFGQCSPPCQWIEKGLKTYINYLTHFSVGYFTRSSDFSRNVHIITQKFTSHRRRYSNRRFRRSHLCVLSDFVQSL